jgi:uncharacterized MAPEG superfamily protein
MATEMQMLVWAIVLGLVTLAIAATLGTAQRGLVYNAGSRDDTKPPLTGVAGRMDRTLKNFLETFPFFAVAVLMVVALGRTNPHTALGAQLYLWGRVAYVPLYAAGLPWVRTVAWAVSLAGIVLVLAPLF